MDQAVAAFSPWGRVAERFGQDPFQLMEKWSDRQLLIALWWMAEEQNSPSRSDHYAMKICQTIWAVHGKSKDMSDFKVPFGRPKSKDHKPDPRFLDDLSTLRSAEWRALMGTPIKVEPPGTAKYELPEWITRYYE